MPQQIEVLGEQEEYVGQYVPDYYLVQSDIFVDCAARSLHDEYFRLLEWLASFGVHLVSVWVAHDDAAVRSCQHQHHRLINSQTWHVQSPCTAYVIEVAASQGAASPAYAIEGAHQWMTKRSITSHCIRLRAEVSDHLRSPSSE
jgi:hypothetical protein